jgi:8-oxo-dGTP diphosphatase
MNTQYDQPLVSIDVVPIRFDRDLHVLQVALGERVNEPFKGELALPGVLLVHEQVEDAAYRALTEKVGYEREDVLALLHIGVFDSAMRDPRGPTLSIGYAALIRDDAIHPTEVEREAAGKRTWHIVARDQTIWGGAGAKLPFDHDTIIKAAVEELGVRIWTDEAITRALLGVQFSTRAAVALTERLRGGVDRTNFNRTLKAQPYLISTGKIAEGVGRSSSLWQFRDGISLKDYARECDILYTEAYRRWQTGRIEGAYWSKDRHIMVPEATAKRHARQGHAD